MLQSFDLKGSLKGRWVKFNPKKYPKGKASPLLKDLNFLELNESQIDKQVVDIPGNDSREICKNIIADCKFLASKQIMDYSLLLVIEKCPEKPDNVSV